jgi:NAD(P)-dependent dehydrogenase (short-subunit alcohol dehydrogenase family)
MLKGKTALITGSAKRIGRACALRLAREGADIIIHYNRSRKEAEELAGAIRMHGRRAWSVCQDLGEKDAGTRLMEKARAKSPDIDYLINSASIFPPSTVSDVDLAAFEENLQINALSPFFLSRAFADQSGKAECIINFLDARIVDYDRANLAYHISKRVLFTLTRVLSMELAPQIRVNALAPGLIIPPPGMGDEYLKSRINSNPLQKIGTLDQITDSLSFLLSNTFVTGQVLFVDGGRHLKGSFYGL